MRRRLIRFSLICLVAGAMINIAVAWGLAARVTVDPPRWNAPLATVAGGQNYVFQLWQQGIALTDSEIVRFLVSTRLWPDERLDDRLRFFARAPSVFSIFSGRGALYLETWRTINPEAERIKSVARLQIIESGWPCRAMRGYSWLLQSNEPSAEATEFHHRGVISLAGVVPRGWAPADTGHAAKLPLLPLRPLWIGFMVNTMLYAAVVWLIFGGLSRVRRILRQRRGQCLRCGYDLRGAAHARCPECGAEVAGSSTKKNGDIASPVAVTEKMR